MVVAWQTNETAPKTSAYKVEVWKQGGRKRVVPPQAAWSTTIWQPIRRCRRFPEAYGAHSNYTAVLSGLAYDTEYQYRVTGPGLPAGGFSRRLPHPYPVRLLLLRSRGRRGLLPRRPQFESRRPSSTTRRASRT